MRYTMLFSGDYATVKLEIDCITDNFQQKIFLAKRAGTFYLVSIQNNFDLKLDSP